MVWPTFKCTVLNVKSQMVLGPGIVGSSSITELQIADVESIPPTYVQNRVKCKIVSINQAKSILCSICLI